MKKLFLSVALVGLGAGTWWLTARTARFSIKKWDAKFETVLRHNLTALGITDQDLLSSVHEVKKDKKGEWVAHQISLKMSDLAKQKELLNELKESGARIEEKMEGHLPVYMVKRGSRLYQEIRFENPRP